MVRTINTIRDLEAATYGFGTTVISFKLSSVGFVELL